MASDWVNEKPNDTGWLDKVPAGPMKTLEEIGIDRQKASEAPKPVAPVIPPPPPIEDIPYDKVSNDLENAAEDVLGAFSRLGRASVNLGKISIIIPRDGDKSKAIMGKIDGFRDHVDGICADLKKMSEDIAEYKNSLPKESTSQI
jgi:hypothetical protein